MWYGDVPDQANHEHDAASFGVLIRGSLIVNENVVVCMRTCAIRFVCAYVFYACMHVRMYYLYVLCLCGVLYVRVHTYGGGHGVCHVLVTWRAV